jgi:hypothetical protein
MTRKEEIQAKAEELYGKVDKSFPLTEFVNEENRRCFKAGAKWADEQEIEFLRGLTFQSSIQSLFEMINDRIKFLKGE